MPWGKLDIFFWGERDTTNPYHPWDDGICPYISPHDWLMVMGNVGK